MMLKQIHRFSQLLLILVCCFFSYIAFRIDYIFVLYSAKINFHLTVFALFYTINFLILYLSLLLSFKKPLISGIILILVSIYGSIFWININSFKFYLLILLIISGISLILVWLLEKKGLKQSTIYASDLSQKKQSKRIVLLLLSIPFIILMASYWLQQTFFVLTLTEDYSMAPTIHQNALILIIKTKYSRMRIKRGDIIEFSVKDPKKGNELLTLQRVIGLPNEKVEWKDYQIFIDGKKLDEPYQFDQFTQTNKLTNQFESVTLKDQEYFVLGDNRNYTYDSRRIGPIQSEDILGKVYYLHDYSE